jgi:glycosyltransferase involved in cell wall biosynthesis
LPFNDDLLTEENSMRIDPNSIEEIKEAISKIYTDQDYRDTIGRLVYKDSQIFSIENRCRRILEFIENNG